MYLVNSSVFSQSPAIFLSSAPRPLNETLQREAWFADEMVERQERDAQPFPNNRLCPFPGRNTGNSLDSSPEGDIWLHDIALFLHQETASNVDFCIVRDMTKCIPKPRLARGSQHKGSCKWLIALAGG